MSDNKGDKLKIAFFSVLPPFRGGISSFSQFFVEELRKISDVKPYTFKKLYPKLFFPGKSQEDPAQGASYPRIVSTMNPLSYFKARKKMRKQDPDVLIVNYWMTIFAPMYSIFSKGFQKKVLKVALLHNLTPHEKRFFDGYFNRLFLKRYDAFVVLSESVKNDLLRQKPNAPCLLLNHPDYNHFGEPIERSEARRKLGIAESSRVILFFGLIRDYKGLDVLIGSMKHLDGSYHLLIAGEVYGEERHYRELIEASNGTSITFRNEYIPDREVATIFSAADLCVLPYKKGTQSGVQAISNSFSVPVLVSKNGGLHENIDDGSNGFIIENLESAPLADQIDTLFSGEALNEVHEKLKKDGMKQNDEWKNFASEVYQFLVKEKSR